MGTELSVTPDSNYAVYDLTLRRRARNLVANGRSQVSVAAELGVSKHLVWRWINHTMPTDLHRDVCWRCHPRDKTQHEQDAYAYLLGQYLGDGHLVTTAKTPVLRIFTYVGYPAILAECTTAITTLRQRAPAHVGPVDSVIRVQSYWKHWPCMLPQHGPGMKHTRPIVLTDWQRDLIALDPRPLIRGLIHSDGCRSLNTIRTAKRAYQYPRYFFSNESADILKIYTDALDALGIEWRANRRNSISVARRSEVAKLDEFVGPKS